jgi:hypothetical protein
MSTQPPSDLPAGVPVDRLVDRLIQALSPALSAEFSLVLGEQKEKLLAEANVQLRKALIDKETELQTAYEAEQVRVLAEASEKVRIDVTGTLESQFEEKLSKELRSLKDRLDEASGRAEMAWQQERAQLTDEASRWRVLADFHRRTGAVISQAEILKRFLKAGEHYAGAVVLYLNKPDGFRRWEGDDSAFPEIVSEDTRDPEWYWAPVAVRSRTVLAVCAAEVRDPDKLDALVSALKRAIENLGFRLGARAAELTRSAEPDRDPVTREVGTATPESDINA